MSIIGSLPAQTTAVTAATGVCICYLANVKIFIAIKLYVFNFEVLPHVILVVLHYIHGLVLATVMEHYRRAFSWQVDQRLVVFC
jgi:hypothetical protein